MKCEIKFKFRVSTQYQQTVRLVGDRPELGSWIPNRGLPLYTDQQNYPVWSTKDPLLLTKGIIYSSCQPSLSSTLPHRQDGVQDRRDEP